MSSAFAGALNREPASKTAQRHRLLVKRRVNRFKWRSPGQREKCTLKNVREILTQATPGGTEQNGLPETRSADAAGNRFRAFGERRLDVVRVGLCDDFELDLFRARRLALA